MVAKDIDRRAHSRRGRIDQPLGKLPAGRDGERKGNAYRVECTGSQSGHIEPEAISNVRKERVKKAEGGSAHHVKPGRTRTGDRLVRRAP